MRTHRIPLRPLCPDVPPTPEKPYYDEYMYLKPKRIVGATCKAWGWRPPPWLGVGWEMQRLNWIRE